MGSEMPKKKKRYWIWLLAARKQRGKQEATFVCTTNVPTTTNSKYEHYVRRNVVHSTYVTCIHTSRTIRFLGAMNPKNAPHYRKKHHRRVTYAINPGKFRQKANMPALIVYVATRTLYRAREF